MELIAAIDLLSGEARRLVQGDYERPINERADPLELAARLLDAGVRRLHVVDLDGAREGRPVNHEVVGKIVRLARATAPGARVQTGGGLRDLEGVGRLLATGVDQVMLGSAALKDPGFLAHCANRWPERAGVSLDLRAGRPQLSGWREEVETDPFELAGRLLGAGAACLQVTDVGRDGTAAGPNLELMAAFRARFPSAVLVAAGGVARASHLAALAGLGLDGAIVGRALLEGLLEPAEALAACSAEVPA